MAEQGGAAPRSWEIDPDLDGGLSVITCTYLVLLNAATIMDSGNLGVRSYTPPTSLTTEHI